MWQGIGMMELQTSCIKNIFLRLHEQNFCHDKFKISDVNRIKMCFNFCNKLEPIMLQNSAPNLSNVVFLPHMPEGAFFNRPSHRIKFFSLELELKSFDKIFNLHSLKYFRFSEIHSKSTVFNSFEFNKCVNNSMLLEYFLLKMKTNFWIQADTLNSYSKELKLISSIKFCKHNLKGILLLTNKTDVFNSCVMFAFETPLLLILSMRM